VTQYTDKYFSNMFRIVSNHYEIGGDHFKELPSYGAYLSLGQAQEASGGADKMYKAFIGGNMIGTPEQLIEHHNIAGKWWVTMRCLPISASAACL